MYQGLSFAPSGFVPLSSDPKIWGIALTPGIWKPRPKVGNLNVTSLNTDLDPLRYNRMCGIPIYGLEVTGNIRMYV